MDPLGLRTGVIDERWAGMHSAVDDSGDGSRIRRSGAKVGLPPIAARWVRLQRHACHPPSAVVPHLIVRLRPVTWGNSHAGANGTCVPCPVMTNQSVLVDLRESRAVMLTAR